VGHGHRAVEHLPAGEPLPQRLADGLLDRHEERVRHRPELDAQPEHDTRSGGPRLHPEPDGGEERVGLDLHDLHGRADPVQPLHTDRGGFPEADVEPELVGERGLHDLLLHLAVQRHRDVPPVPAQVDQRVLLGEQGERCVQGAALRRRGRHDHGFERRRREMARRAARPGSTDRVADADAGQAPQGGDLPGRDLLPAHRPTTLHGGETGDLAGTGEAVPYADRAGVKARVGHLLARRAPLDLEHGAGQRPVRIAIGARQQLGEAGRQRVHAGAGDRRSELVVSRRPTSASTRSRSAPVRSILLTNSRGRDAQALQRAHEHAGLRLHALDGRQHEYRAVEHVEHPLHLGDEVRVAGGVDQVDGDGVGTGRDRERDHCGPDRDAAPTFEVGGVGLRVAVVDAADLVDNTGVVEQPFGQAGLTGVDMGDDPEVERASQASCPSAMRNREGRT
jgi:hypothetical protein